MSSSPAGRPAPPPLSSSHCCVWVLFNGSCHVRCSGEPWVTASPPEEPPEFVGERKFTSHGWVFLSICDTVRSVHCSGRREGKIIAAFITHSLTSTLSAAFHAFTFLLCDSCSFLQSQLVVSRWKPLRFEFIPAVLLQRHKQIRRRSVISDPSERKQVRHTRAACPCPHTDMDTASKWRLKQLHSCCCFNLHLSPE